MAAIAQNRDGRPRAGRPRRAGGQRAGGRSWPATYLVAIVALGLTIVPLLLVVVKRLPDQRRHQRQTRPACPTPGSWATNTAILKSAAFWELIGNSTLIAVVRDRTGPRARGRWPRLALSQYEFKGPRVLLQHLRDGPAVSRSPPRRCRCTLELQRLGLPGQTSSASRSPRAAFGLPLTMIIPAPVSCAA